MFYGKQVALWLSQSALNVFSEEELDEMEHVTNTLGEDRLSVEVRVLVDDRFVDDIVAEGARS